MNKSELIEITAKEADISKAAAEKALSAAMGAIVKAVAKGDTVTLVGFGTFKSSKRAARVGRNPQTGKELKIAASHIDSPSLKIKGASQKNVANTSKVGVEVYGGPIIHTWLDRELGLAGSSD